MRIAFNCEAIFQQKFNDIEELDKYIKQESNKLVLVPINDFINKKAEFINDKYFGTNNEMVKFNDNGFYDLCRLLNISPNIFKRLKQKHLCSNILNDLFYQNTSILNNNKFVLDENEMIVTGIVSNSYLPYSNASFVNDIFTLFPELTFDYSFESAFIINSNLFARFLSKEYKVGSIKGKGGEGKDISRIGISISNSMTGNGAIKISYFVYRLICKNGLIIPVNNIATSVHHTGRVDTLQDRIEQRFTKVFESMRSVPKQIEELISLPFNKKKFVEIGGIDKINSIISLDEQLRNKRSKAKGEKKVEVEIEILENYIEKYSGKYSIQMFQSYWRDNQSIYDFINIFTEYAQTKNHKERLHIEEKSGELASWILSNKKSFK